MFWDNFKSWYLKKKSYYSGSNQVERGFNREPVTHVCRLLIIKANLVPLIARLDLARIVLYVVTTLAHFWSDVTLTGEENSKCLYFARARTKVTFFLRTRNRFSMTCEQFTQFVFLTISKPSPLSSQYQNHPHHHSY